MIARSLPMAALLMAWPYSVHAAALSGGAGVSISPWRVIGSLLLCLALGAVAIIVLRRHYGLGQAAPRSGAASRRIRVVEQQSLGPHRSLSLVEIDRQTYVVLVAPGTAALTALPGPPAEQTAGPGPGDGVP